MDAQARSRAISIRGPLKLKLQLMSGSEPAIGPGRALVLEAIGRTGSISAAGRALGMSYRRTWLHVDAMNRCWITPLVETYHGGGAVRGARLTELGRAVLRSFRALESRLEAATAGSDYDFLLTELRADPVPLPDRAAPLSDV